MSRPPATARTAARLASKRSRSTSTQVETGMPTGRGPPERGGRRVRDARLLHLHHGSEWLASTGALWALGTAAVLEIAADKVPMVDHALDAVGTVLRPLAAAAGAFAVLGGWGEPWAGLVSLVLGAGAL